MKFILLNNKQSNKKNDLLMIISQLKQAPCPNLTLELTCSFFCQSNLHMVQRSAFMSKSRAAVQFAHTGCEAGRRLIAPSTTRHTHRQTDQNIPPHIQIQSGRFPPIPTAPFRVRLAHTHARAQRSSHLGVTHVSTCLPLRRHLECNNSVRR